MCFPARLYGDGGVDRRALPVSSGFVVSVKKKDRGLCMNQDLGGFGWTLFEFSPSVHSSRPDARKE